MKIKSTHFLFALFFVVSLACNSIIGLPEEAETNAPPLTASGNGPQGLTAEATSADSVLLTWQPVDGATSYHILVSDNGDEALDVINLSPEVTSYEDYMASPDSRLTYAVEAVGDSGSIGQSIVNVTTPARVPNPLQVLVEFDDSSKVTQMIGPTGGTISLTDGSSVSYEFIIPPNALSEEIEVVLTPVADLSQWPLDGEMLGVVGIEPEGYWLSEPATLTITPAAGKVSDELSTVGFAFSGFGQEFALRPAVDSPLASTLVPGGTSRLARPDRQIIEGITQFISNLRPAGAGQASPERAGEMVKENPPTDSADAMEQKEAASSVEEDELAPLETPQEMELERALDRYAFDIGNVVRAIKRASDCQSLRGTIDSFQIVQNEAKDLPPDKRSPGEDKAWEELVDKTKEILDDAAEECKDLDRGQVISGGPCAYGVLRNIASGSSPFYKEMQRRMIEKHGKDVINELDEKFKKDCKPGYNMMGGTEGLKVKDRVCELTKPFTVNGSVYGGAVAITFTPFEAEEGVLPAGGAYEYQGSGGGVSLRGNGSFSMMGNLATDVYLRAYGPGQAAEYGATGGENYTLTKRDYICGSND